MMRKTLSFVSLFLLSVTAMSQGQTQPAFPPVEDVNGCRMERFDIQSAVMKRPVRAWAVLPPSYDSGEKPFPLLIALHGSRSDYEVYAKMSPLTRGLIERPMVLCGFEAGATSWYLDATLDPASQIETFFFDEYLPALQKRFRVDPAKMALTGYSMGGFGAFHFALRRPELFSSISSLSGALQSSDPPNEKVEKRLTPLIGSFKDHSDTYVALDLKRRLKALRESGKTLPPIYLECGTEDSLLETNRQFQAFLTEQGLRSTYRETAGAHAFPFWRDASPRVLEFHWTQLTAPTTQPGTQPSTQSGTH